MSDQKILLIVDDEGDARLRRLGLLAMAAAASMIHPPAGQLSQDPPPLPYEPETRTKVRGTRRAQQEGLAAMMARLGAGAPLRYPWATPTLRQVWACYNCDAEHDGVDWHPNHVADVYCRYYEDP